MDNAQREAILKALEELRTGVTFATRNAAINPDGKGEAYVSGGIGIACIQAAMRTGIQITITPRAEFKLEPQTFSLVDIGKAAKFMATVPAAA